MSEERLRELYTAPRRAGPPARRRHPSPEALAALARREGSEEERLATLDHVMSCGDCRRDFDLLRTLERAGAKAGAARPLRPSSLVHACGPGRVPARRGRHRTAGAQPGDDDTTRGDERVPSRSCGPARGRAGESLTFAWRPVPGASRYELELLDAGGGVALDGRPPTPSPPPAPGLPPGDYKWWVRATTSDARTLRSALRPLRLTTSSRPAATAPRPASQASAAAASARGAAHGRGIPDHREPGPFARRCATADGRELRRAERIAHRRAACQPIVQVMDQLNRTSVADPPLGRDHRPRARFEQRRGESLQPLARHHHAAGRSAGRQHDEIRVEPERGDVRRREEAILPRPGRQGERRARERALVHQRMRGQVDHAVPFDRRA